MKRAFELLDELRDIIQGKSRFEITEIAGGYLEGVRVGCDAPTRSRGKVGRQDALPS